MVMELPSADMRFGERHPVSQVKRFLEVWAADSEFRHALQSAPRSAATSRGLHIDPEDIRPLWDTTFHSGWSLGALQEDAFPLVKAYCALREHKQNIIDSICEDCTPVHPTFRVWRERQIARTSTEFPSILSSSIQHPPFAIELSIGCSVGCWFCGVDAKPLDRYLPYTNETASLWREVLEILGDVAGQRAASRGFLYWATEPLDNPEYEKFASDFQRIFKLFPHTTTARPLQNIDRIRHLLQHTGPDAPLLLRFSVLSARILNRLHTTFTADELAFVEVIPQTPGSIIELVPSGRARNRTMSPTKRPSLAHGDNGRTISCVTGFLLNMLERSIKLVTPCSVSDQWPYGYYVLAQASFVSAQDLKSIIVGMIKDHMLTSPSPSRLLSFRRDLRFETIDGGFRLSGEGGGIEFGTNVFITELGAMIHSAEWKVASLVAWFEAERGLPEELPRGWIDHLFKAGV